jgi:hypothetical protein
MEDKKKYNTLTIRVVQARTDAEILDEYLKYLLDKQIELQRIIRDASAKLDKVNEEIMLTIKLYMKAK